MRILTQLVFLALIGVLACVTENPRDLNGGGAPPVGCSSAADCDGQYCHEEVCVQCTGDEHCRVPPLLSCVANVCIEAGVESDAASPADAQTDSGPPPIVCGSIDERSEAPDEEDDPLEQLCPDDACVCVDGCSGNDVCVPPGACRNICLAPLPCTQKHTMRAFDKPNGDRFEIDAYEASKPDADREQQGCSRNKKACSVQNVLPWEEVSWEEADEACRRVGKRLCSVEEWRIACRGSCRFDFPYGDDFIEAACNEGNAGRNTAWATGSRDSCSTPEWIYDLVANLREWTSDVTVAGSRAVIGGTMRHTSHLQLGCGADPESFGEREHRETIGFRCCRSLP